MQIGKNISRVLAFFAHPDDETLAAGATMAQWATQGVEVHVAIPATGITSRLGFSGAEAKAEIEKLHSQTQEALGILGLSSSLVHFGEFPDNAMDSDPLLKLIQWLESVMRKVRPDVILTHHRFCTNIDHQYCHEAAVVATRPSQEQKVLLLCGEVSSSTGYLRPTGFEPNFYVDVSEDMLDKKLTAMQAYKSEIQPDPHPRSVEVLRAVAKVRGAESGSLYAEAFMVQRMFG